MRQLRPFLTRCFMAALLWASLGTSVLATVHDHISQRAYWQDASAQATLDQARAHNFTPYEGVLSQGYTPSAIWIQLRIQPTEKIDANDKLVLRIRPTYLDEITLFDPLDTSGQLRQTGDQISYSKEEFKSLTHTFVIPAGTESRDIWLRLKATSTTLMHIEALSVDDMQIDEHRLLATYYSVLALILVFLLVVLINWINYREFLYAAFVARNIIYFVYSGAFFGFHRYLLSDHIDAHTLDYVYNWLIVCTTAFSFWFETRFLSEYAPPQWVKNIFYGMYLWSFSSAILLILGHTNLALKVNMMLNGAGILILLSLSMLFIQDRHQTGVNQAASLLKKKFVVGYYLILAALLMFTVLPYLGSIAGTEFSANGLVYYALVSGLDMTLLLQLRANQMRKAHLQSEQALALSKQQIEFEKIRREEQSQMLTMLMHELKNPLAVIDLAQQTSSDTDAKDYVNRNVSIIRNVLDQCLSADRLSDGKLVIHNQALNVLELTHDLIDQNPALSSRVVVSHTGSMHTIQTDYECCQIVLNNLLQNALRYGASDHPIEVSLHNSAHANGTMGTCITVANKPGIASWPDADKVFQKYYRSTGAKSISGSGLGLFLVRSMCTLLGGTCTYEPSDTHVRFNVWLPH